jgi:hypothetical protein
MGYFQSYLFRPAPRFQGTLEAEIKPDLGYALGRGWSRETLAEAGMGSFGSDREGLRRAGECGAWTLSCRRRWRCWAGGASWPSGPRNTASSCPRPGWKAERIPGMPRDMLIYPHLVRGRTVYLAGRAIEGDSPAGRPDRPSGSPPTLEPAARAGRPAPAVLQHILVHPTPYG